MPCAIHGDEPEPWPENIWLWNLYWEHIAPTCIKYELISQRGGLVTRSKLDIMALDTIIQYYQVRDRRAFLEDVQALFSLTQA